MSEYSPTLAEFIIAIFNKNVIKYIVVDDPSIALTMPTSFQKKIYFNELR